MKLAKLALVLFLAGSMPSYGRDWGSLPEGYSWYESEECHVAVPVPQGWHVKTTANGDTKAVFITKENIDEAGQFLTGYSLNCTAAFSKKNKTRPSLYATAFIEQVTKSKKEVVLEPWGKELAPKMYGAGIRYRDKGAPDLLVHYYLLADDAEDSLRFMIFEAPESEWEAAWKHGELMLTRGQLWKTQLQLSH